MRRRRSRATRDAIPLFGGRKRGVVVTDAAGNQMILAFTGSGSDVILGDGTIGPAGSGPIPLVTGEEPPVFVTDGAGHLVYVTATI